MRPARLVVVAPSAPRAKQRVVPRGVAAIALTLSLAHPAHAQSGGTARIEGTVTDSVHARSLAGIRVVAAGTGNQAEIRADATTD